MNTSLPTPGHIVLYVLPIDHKRAGEIRPAIVLRTNPSSVNLHVFDDGPNDRPCETNWVGSASEGAADESGAYPHGTWHWPPRA